MSFVLLQTSILIDCIDVIDLFDNYNRVMKSYFNFNFNLRLKFKKYEKVSLNKRACRHLNRLVNESDIIKILYLPFEKTNMVMHE